MNTLKIQQGLTVETVTTSIINKLYEAALSVSEPLEGEEDDAYLSGNIWVGRASQNKVKYLAGTVLVRGVGDVNNNPTGRFHDLKINITDEYYIDFEDSTIEGTLITKGFSSDGYGITISDAANATFTNSTFAGQWDNQNTSITKFNEFKYFTKANNNPPTGLFRYCPNLTEIDLSNCTKFSLYEFAISGVQVVNAPLLQSIGGNESFNGCRLLTTVTSLGSVITTIPYGMFYNCPNLQTVNLPTTVISIGELVFLNDTNVESSFTTITGTQNVTTVGNLAFKALHSIILDSSYFPELTTVGNGAFNGCYNFTGELNFPKLTSIGSSAFRLCGFSKIKNLGKISAITNNCFLKNSQRESALTEVYLPYECTSIGAEAFRQNKALTTIKQYTDSVDNWVEGLNPTYGDPSRITSIGNKAFYDCKSLNGVTQSNFPNLINVGEDAFARSSIGGHWDLTNFINIGKNAFLGSAITEITIPNSKLDSIRDILQAFSMCINLTQINADFSIATTNPTFFALSGLSPFIIYQPLVTLLGYAIFKSEYGLDYLNNDSNHISAPYWTHLYYPNLTTTVGSYCYFRHNGDLLNAFTSSNSGTDIDLIYVKDVLTLDKHTFPKGNKIEAFVINNTTVPKIIQHERDGLTTQTEVYAFSGWDGSDNGYYYPASGGNSAVYHMIYVPDSAVQDYKTAWPVQADHIYSIYNLNSGVIFATETDWVAAGKPVGLIAEYLGLSTEDLATFVTANNLTYWTNPNM